jgi:hypothetical protein
MPQAEDDVERAIEAAAAGPFQGRVWRVHWREVAGDDWSLSLRTSGRYHRGLDLFAPGQAFAALYTSLAPEIAIWEMVRRSAARNLAYLRNNVLTEIEVDLERVLDVSNPSAIGATRRDLSGPDLEGCQQIAATARSLRLEGLLLIPSATLLGPNLVLFPDNLASPGSLRIERSTELPLDAIVEQHREDEPTQYP